MKNAWLDVLRYRPVKVPQATVRRHYERWRAENGIPNRCDNPKCRFHRSAPSWLGKPLRLILDHVEGNRFDNRPKMLQLLCPNCESQRHTSGGRNRGRIKSFHSAGFTLVQESGALAHTQFGSARIRLIPNAKQTYTPNNALEQMCEDDARDGPTLGVMNSPT